MSYQGMQQHKDVKRQEQLHYDEGKSPAAWAGSWISLAAFIVLTYTTTFGFEQFGWAGVIVPSAIILLAGVLTLVMKAQGYGTPARDL